MMNLKFNSGTPTVVISISTFLASVVVTLKNLKGKFFSLSGVVEPPISTAPISMIWARLNPVFILRFCKALIPRHLALFRIKPFLLNFWIIFHKFMDVFPAKKTFMALLVSHLGNRGVVIFCKSLIPGGKRSKLSCSAFWMVPTNIFWKFYVRRKSNRIEYFTTTALANSFFCLLFTHFIILSVAVAYTGNITPIKEGCQVQLRELLEYPNSLKRYNVAGNGERDSMKRFKDWTISSQAAQEWVEGSTIRAWSPERTVKPHECAARKGRYDLIYMETYRATINSWPLTQMNSVAFTGKLATLSNFNVKDSTTDALKKDWTKVLDKGVEAKMDATKIRYVASTGSTYNIYTDGTATQTASVGMDKFHFRSIVDYMMGTLLVPPLSGEDYMAILSVSAYSGLYGSLEAVWQYTKYPTNGEVGKYYNCRVVRESNALDNTIGVSNVTGEGYFFGEDPVLEAVAQPEEIRFDVKDGGRDQRLYWNALIGFDLIWQQDPDCRVVKFDSHA